MISDQRLRIVLRSNALVAMTGDLVRGVLFIAVVGAVARYVMFYVTSVREMVTDWHMNDFGKFYYASRAFLEGRPMYGPTPATETVIGPHQSLELWDMNPPQFHLLILPISQFNPVHAIVIWGCLNVIALVLSLYLVARELRIRATIAGTVWTLLGIVAFSATATTVVTGQLTFLVLLPMTLAWIAARHDRWTQGALFLGLAASVKPFLGIFLIYLLVRKLMKPAAILVVTVLSSGLAGLAVFGWRSYRDWVGVLSSITWYWSPMNVSIAGLLARTFDDSAFFTAIVRAPSVVRPFASVLGLVIGVVTLLALVRDTSTDRIDRTFVGLVLAALLISPLGSVYYLWFLVGPGLALWHSSRVRKSSARDTLVLLATPGLIWPVVLTTLWGRSPWAGVTIGSIYSWTTLLLWAGMLVDWSAQPPAE